MEGSSAKKSKSQKTLVVLNTNDIEDLKLKLREIIEIGKDYAHDVSSCIKSLLNSSDEEIVTLSAQAISEFAKCDEKRDTYAEKDVIHPVLKVLEQELTTERLEITKQSCRVLGNLCCDCDTARSIILEADGVPTMIKLLETTVDKSFTEIRDLLCKTLLNFAIGGQEYSDAIVKENNVLCLLHKILHVELFKVDVDDDIILTILSMMNILNEYTPELLFPDDINKDVLKILRETTNVEVSEQCLEHLHAQTEHDSVKTLVANEGGIQLVCFRLEQLMMNQEVGDVSLEEYDLESIIKQACDLIIIVLTGDEAMQTLYQHGAGEVYLTLIRWLDSTNQHLLSTAVLAVGNFARKDGHCVQMMEANIFEKLLDIFETYHNLSLKIQADPDSEHPIDAATVSKIQHGALSALRNLSVPVANKHKVAGNARAVSLFINALPNVKEHNVAYKLMGTIRMLLHGQTIVAEALAKSPDALAAVGQWAASGAGGGAADEAPRLLSWCVTQLKDTAHWKFIVRSGSSLKSMVRMLVATHSVMQNEAIIGLTLLAIGALRTTLDDNNASDFNYERSFTVQMLSAEIGKHITSLIDANSAKMPIELVDNLLAFLEVTSAKNDISTNYKKEKVHASLQKLAETRNDLCSEMRSSITALIKTISDGA